MPSVRVALAVVVLAILAALAAVIEGGLLTPLGMLLGGLIGGLAMWATQPADTGIVDSLGETEATLPLPDVVTLTDDAAMILDGNRVIHANAAARGLLGPHIEDEDLRLAIRNPAVAEHLASGSTAPLDVIGLGESSRRFELHAIPIAPGFRFIRLADRTQAHVTDQMRTDFVANASHELRTPLATILGFIETLQDANRPEDAATRTRFLGIMLGEARRMRQLVDDLVSLSRIEADRFSPPRDPLLLASLAEEVAATITTAEALMPQRLIVTTESGLPAVAGDRAQLSQLLHNLIGNALKYGRVGTPIRIDLSRDGDTVRLDVVDQGDGIPSEHLPRLTERFYRVDPGRSRAAGGTGLGLAIVKHIVERHRGRLEIESAVGVGSRFRVRLPVLSEPLSS
jgi:two-component system phosphate regulon sensor histidine kinase PhoR